MGVFFHHSLLFATCKYIAVSFSHDSNGVKPTSALSTDNLSSCSRYDSPIPGSSHLVPPGEVNNDIYHMTGAHKRTEIHRQSQPPRCRMDRNVSGPIMGSVKAMHQDTVLVELKYPAPDINLAMNATPLLSRIGLEAQFNHACVGLISAS